MGQTKKKVLKIANINPIAISIEQVIKERKNKLRILLIEVRDRRNNLVMPIWRNDSLIPQQNSSSNMTELVSVSREKKYLGLLL